MLADIAEQAVARVLRNKSKWTPPTLTREDLRQEAWVAVLGAQRDGVIDPDELQRAAEIHVNNVIRRERRRPEVPVDPARFTLDT